MLLLIFPLAVLAADLVYVILISFLLHVVLNQSQSQFGEPYFLISLSYLWLILYNKAMLKLLIMILRATPERQW